MSKMIVHAGWIAMFLLAGSSAEARIVCNEGFQLSGGREISTPYCNDNYVAEVARKHGMKVSDQEVRNNPARKDEVCRFIGSDTRISNYCNTDEGYSRHGR
jgi:hypothetical protein